MAFTTEFVMGAGGEYRTIPTAANSSSSVLTVATATVGAGRWIAVYEATPVSFNTWSVAITPGELAQMPSIGTGSATGRFSAAQIVTGPATVTVAAQRASAGTLHLARID